LLLHVGFALSWFLDGCFCLAVWLAGDAHRMGKVFPMHTGYALLIYTVNHLAILAPLTPSKEAAVLAGVHVGLYTASLAITAPVAIIHCHNLLFFHDNGVDTPWIDMEKATNLAAI
jgi:hypothetical protein